MLIGLHFCLVVLSSYIVGKGVKGLCVSLMKLCLSSKMFMEKKDLARRHLRRVLVLKYLMSLVFCSRKMFAGGCGSLLLVLFSYFCPPQCAAACKKPAMMMLVTLLGWFEAGYRPVPWLFG
jgi:hypothetical protein